MALLPVNRVVMLSLHGHNHLCNVYVEFCHRARLPGVRVESGKYHYTRPKPCPASGCTCPRERGNISAGRADLSLVYCQDGHDGRTQMVVAMQ